MLRKLRLNTLEDRTAAAVWSGGGADANWMTPENWVGDVAPVAGDVLIFPDGAARIANTNNFTAGTNFASLSVSGTGYNITGNAVALTAGVSADIANGVSTLGLELDGAGGFTKAGAGTLALAGANTYSGPTAVNAGFLDVRSNAALGATGAGNETVVNDGGTLSFCAVDTVTTLNVGEAITFSGLGAPALPTGTSGALKSQSGRIVLNGALTLGADSSIVANNGSELTITQGIGEAGGPCLEPARHPHHLLADCGQHLHGHNRCRHECDLQRQRRQHDDRREQRHASGHRHGGTRASQRRQRLCRHGGCAVNQRNADCRRVQLESPAPPSTFSPRPVARTN